MKDTTTTPLDPDVPDLSGVSVAVLSGGRSTERAVSLASGRGIQNALANAPEGDDRGPARLVGVEWLEDGRFAIDGREGELGALLAALADVDVVFSALHGGEGENGSVQGLFTCGDLAFTGSSVRASAIGMDKVFVRAVLAERGLRIAPGACVSRSDWERDPEAVLDRLLALGEREPGGGTFVKPRCGGSSVGTSMVEVASELGSALTRAFGYEGEALVEARIHGLEFAAGVVTTPDGELLALPLVEIRPKAGRFFDYEEKYTDDGALEVCPPTSGSRTAWRRMQELALVAHRELGAEGYSRSDFILPHGEDEPVFLELNTLPGMTARSLVPLAASALGIDFRTLCLWIAADGLRRGARRG